MLSYSICSSHLFIVPADTETINKSSAETSVLRDTELSGDTKNKYYTIALVT